MIGGTQIILLVEHADDVSIARQCLKVDAVPYDQLTAEVIAGRKVVVVTETPDAGLRRLNDIVSSGINPRNARFVDIGYGTTLRSADLDDVRLRLARPKDFLWDNTRSMDQWPAEEPLTTYSTKIEGLDGLAKFTFPEVALICGGYGSGKSTIAQMMGLKLAHGYGWPISICAWEDRRSRFRDRLWRTAIGMDARQAAQAHVDPQAAFDLEKLVLWTEPLTLNERALAAYFERIKFLTEAHGVKVHVCDPWNEFDHDISGERETVYIRKMMMEAAKLTRELGVIFLLVTHLPKSGYTENGGVKPFRIVNAAGSAEFGNKADHGFCVVRTKIISDILKGDYTDERVSKYLLRTISDEFGSCKGTEHMILAVDKVKVEPDMGRRGALAYVLDPETNNLIFDTAGTQIAAKIWNVF